MRSIGAPLTVAVVACPARSEWPETGTPSKPAALARSCTLRPIARAPIRSLVGWFRKSTRREQRSWFCGANPEPLIQGPDRIRERVAATGDPDELAVGVLVGLGAADGDQDAGWLALEVLDVESRDLARPHRGGVAEEQDGAVADVLGVAVSMAPTIWPSWGTVSGWAGRIGATPRIRRSPRRTRRTRKSAVGSANPSWRWRWAMPEQ